MIDKIKTLEVNTKHSLATAEKKVSPFEPFMEEDKEELQELLLNFFKENQDTLCDLIDIDDEECEPLDVAAPPPLFAYSSVPSIDPSHYSAHVVELFEKLISELTCCHHNGDTKTTFFLSSPHSIFSGSQILIEQFSTAPKSFNVTLISNPQAISVFNSHLESLLQQFKQKELSFSIHRVEVSLSNDDESLYLSKDRDNKENKEKEER